MSDKWFHMNGTIAPSLYSTLQLLRFTMRSYRRRVTFNKIPTKYLDVKVKRKSAENSEFYTSFRPSKIDLLLSVTVVKTKRGTRCFVFIFYFSNLFKTFLFLGNRQIIHILNRQTNRYHKALEFEHP